jgi:hypothetical protein
MINLTRSEALSYARVELLRLAMRATEVEGSNSEYICRLADTWAAALGQMSKTVSASLVNDESWRVLNRLTATINDPTLTPDAMVEWVDAFPEAVSDLLAEPVAEVVSEVAVYSEVAAKAVTTATRAGNNQSALALAA